MPEQVKRTGKAVKKVTLTKSWTGDVYLQSGGTERSMKELRESVMEDIGAAFDAPVRLASLNVYVKPEEGRAYYAARVDGAEEEINGSVGL